MREPRLLLCGVGIAALAAVAVAVAVVGGRSVVEIVRKLLADEREEIVLHDALARLCVVLDGQAQGRVAIDVQHVDFGAAAKE